MSFIPEPRADQALPFHFAMRLAATLPIIVKPPLMKRLPLPSTHDGMQEAVDSRDAGIHADPVRVAEGGVDANRVSGTAVVHAHCELVGGGDFDVGGKFPFHWHR